LSAWIRFHLEANSSILLRVGHELLDLRLDVGRTVVVDDYDVLFRDDLRPFVALVPLT